ncbi:MAG: hypothetical protein WA441_04530 [Methyloceanibacter sp.]
MADQAGPLHFVLGFNLVIDRIATMPLMTTVGATIEKGAQTLTLCMSSIGGSGEVLGLLEKGLGCTLA